MDKNIQKIFGLDRLYDRKYGYAFIVDIFYLVFAVTIIYNWLRSSWFSGNEAGLLTIATFALLCAAALYYIQELLQTLAIRSRLKSRSAHPLSEQNNPVKSSIGVSAVSEEFESYPKTTPIRLYPTGTVYDIRREYYRKTKYGTYKSKESYYTVFEYKLLRSLPNVIFDARKAKGRQFSKYYVGAQKIQLEGNFSDYFEVYSPHFYQIDSLSFITPEVMEALLDLKQYDFEINGNSLLCYAPLLRNDEIDSVAQKIQIIYDTLNNNLDTYRDERLEYQYGKQQVTEFAGKLLLSPRKYLPNLTLSGAASLLFIFLGISYDSYWITTNYALASYIIFAYTCFQIIRLHLRNNRAIEQFKNNTAITKRVLESRAKQVG